MMESCRLYERVACTPSAQAQKLYFFPQWAGHFICNADFSIEREKYDSFLLIYTHAGSGKFSFRGQEIIAHPGALIAINCAEKHAYIPCSEEEWEFSFLHFAGLNWESMYEYLYNANENILFSQNPAASDLLLRCIDLCKSESASKEAQISKKIHDLLYTLISDLQQEQRDKVDLVCNYIAENYEKRLTTQFLSNLCGYSRCYFSTLFKKITGATPYDYLLCYRLNKAKELLYRSSHSVSRIAELTGFQDTGSFIRAFKKKETVSPLQYKKQIQPGG